MRLRGTTADIMAGHPARRGSPLEGARAGPSLRFSRSVSDGLETRPSRPKASARDLGCLDLAALVPAAGAARAVGEGRLAAVLALDELDGGHLVVVGATHVALARGGFPLGDGHGLLLVLLRLRGGGVG